MSYAALTVCRNPACTVKTPGLFHTCPWCGWSIFDEKEAQQ